MDLKKAKEILDFINEMTLQELRDAYIVVYTEKDRLKQRCAVLEQSLRSTRVTVRKDDDDTDKGLKGSKIKKS